MSTVNPIPISPLDTHEPYYLPSTSRMNGLDWRGRDDEDDEEPRRGRDTSPRPLPNLHSRSVSPARNPNPFEFTRRKSSSTIHSAIIQAHHTLPSISTYSRSRSQASSADGAGDGNALIPLDPVLYLPPLLSPLPTSIRHGGQGQRIKTTSHADLEFATRLPDIDPASLALHQTLHNFRPLDETYSTTDYDQAFNWADINLPEDVEREWYCVVFRSRRNKESSSLSLYQADREAHEEAVKNGGLILYWYGVPDAETGSNLATCIWQSRKHAINAISGPKHRTAMLQAKDAYEIYDLERWVLTKRWGERGVSLDRWRGGDVGW